MLPLLHNLCSHHLVLTSVSQHCVPISLPSVSLYLIPPTVSQILFSGVYLPVSCSHFPSLSSPGIFPPHFGSCFPKFKYLFFHQATVLLLGSMIFPGGQEIRDEEAGWGRLRLLTEGLGMPERLSDVEGWNRDLLGSKDLNEGGGSAPGFCWAVASPGWREGRKESDSMIEAPFFSVALGTGFWWCGRFGPNRAGLRALERAPSVQLSCSRDLC